MRKKLVPILILIFVGLVCIYVIDFGRWDTRKKIEPLGPHSVGNTLSSADVRCFCQDADGIMWIGTSDGLNLYDGHHYVRLYNDANDSSTICSDKINCMVRDSAGVMWVGSATGLSRYDGAYRFRNFKLGSSDTGIIQVFSVGEDSILACNGKSVYSVAHGEVRKLYEPAAATPFMVYCYPDTLGGFWIITPGTVTLYDSQKKPLIQIPYYATNLVTVDGTGQWLWLTQGHNVALYDMKLRKRVFEEKFDNIIPTMIHALDGERAYLVTGKHGLFEIDRNGRLKKTDGTSMGLKRRDNFISAFYHDQDGNMWVGYEQGGYQVVSATQEAFDQANRNALCRATAGENIMLITPMGGSLLACGSDRFYYYTPRTDELAETPFDDIFTDSPFYRQTMVDMEPLDGNRLWLVSNVRVLSCEVAGGHINVRGRMFSRYHVGPTMTDCVHVGEDLYITTGSGYLLRAAYGSVKPDSIAVPIPSYDHFTKLAALPDGRVLLFMRGMDLATYDPGTGRIEKLDAANEADCQNTTPSFVHVDKKGRVWLGTTHSGLFMLEADGGSVVKAEGMPVVSMAGVADYDDDRLWVCTKRDMLRYNPVSNAIEAFNVRSGDASQIAEENFLNNVCLTNDGQVVFASSDGCGVLPAAGLIRNSQQTLSLLPVIINKVDNRNLVINSHCEDGDKYTLAHSENDITIQFVSTGYGSHSLPRYQVMLEGHDNDWRPATSSNSVNYADLPADSYTFRVRLISSGNLPPLAEKSIRIVVRPAIWASWAAYYLYILCLALAIYYINSLYIRIRTNRLQLAQEKTEKELERKTNAMNMSFFANISHEFRNPLTIIAGPLMVLQTDTSLPRAVRQTITTACKSVNRMLRLIDQMLDFNQLENDVLRLKVAEYDVVHELDQLADSFKDSAQVHDITLMCVHEETNVYAWMDLDKFEKIISNLFTNALKHTPYGGLIRLSLSMVDRQEAAAAGLDIEKDQKRFMQVEIYNNGPAIEEAHLADVFKRYYQVKGVKGDHKYGWGTGLGLYYVSRLVELHRGRISVENADGGGVTFRFILPADECAFRDAEHVGKEDGAMQIKLVSLEEDGEDLVEKNKEEVNAMVQRPKILVVDDDTDVSMYVRSIFSDDYVVVNKYSAEAALAEMDEIRPDVILSDVMMGAMNGYEFCRTLKSNIAYSHIPMVLITAKSNIAEQVEGLRQGAVAYVTKPFDPRYLKALVESLLRDMAALREKLGKAEPAAVDDGQLAEPDRKFMAELYSLMEEHLADDELNVTTISKALLISHSKFNYKVKELTGETPGAFFRKYKLMKAARLLREGDHTVSEIAYLTGFGTVSYFSVAFKKQFGVSPSEYK